MLSGGNPTPQYSGQLIVNHIEDFGFIRFLMGYASAISVVLLLLVYAISRATFKLLGERD
jgi:multiple sugar transport system permease protein